MRKIEGKMASPGSRKRPEIFTLLVSRFKQCQAHWLQCRIGIGINHDHDMLLTVQHPCRIPQWLKQFHMHPLTVAGVKVKFVLLASQVHSSSASCWLPGRTRRFVSVKISSSLKSDVRVNSSRTFHA